MHFSDFKKIILKINDFKLPGSNSLIKLAPPSRVKQLKDGFKIKEPKMAGVMLLFYQNNDRNTGMTLILRNTYNGIHSNQISFPGGKMEDSDVDLKDTALRETVEELGVDKNLISVIRPISKVYIPPSNYIVQPFISIYNGKPFFKPDFKEVSSIINPSLEDLLKLEIVQSVVSVKNKKVIVPSYIIDNHVVWGATAMMINEFIDLFKEMVNS
jgi:8-oxo-dGTP pyrophosphatase MutT (NUDIX family)